MKNLTEYLNEGLFDRIKTNRMYKKTWADRTEDKQAPKEIVTAFNKIVKSFSFNMQEFKEYMVLVNNWKMEEVLKKNPKYRNDEKFQEEFMFDVNFTGDRYVSFLVGDYNVYISFESNNVSIQIFNYKNRVGGAMDWCLGPNSWLHGGPDQIWTLSFRGAFDIDDYEYDASTMNDKEDLWNTDWVKKTVAAYKPFGGLALGHDFVKNEKDAVRRLKEVFNILEKMAR